LPTSGLTSPPLIAGNGFRAWHTDGANGSLDGISLEFPVLRAPGAALSLGAFALLCGLMPAIGLSALLPLQTANASAMLTLALIGGLAAPFILASVVFAVLAIYLLANSLSVDITAQGIRAERRVFGRVTRVREIATDDIADIEPRIGARYQNIFSATPRYSLVARHRTDRAGDMVVAENLAGQALMTDLLTLISTALRIKII
jgi:hypothetical protein